jgi:hypothetical protein
MSENSSSPRVRRRVSAPLFVALILGGVIAGFLIIWVSIVNYVSSGGWKILAKNYPDISEVSSGQKIPVGFAQFNNTNYRGGAVSLETLPQGLRLTTFSVFKLGHPPILIPWSDLENIVSDGADNGSFVTKKVPEVHMQFYNLTNLIIQKKQQYGK